MRPQPTKPPERERKRLLHRDDLRDLGISYSRAHLHKMIKAGRFPPPVALGPTRYARKCWRIEDVEAWIAKLPAVGGEAA